MSRPWRAIRRGLLVLAGGLLLAVAGIELASRRPPPPAAFPMDKARISLWAARERQHPWLRGATNELRVAILGDSITAGAGVQGYCVYGQQLEWMLNLNRDTPPAAVGVFAQAGTSPVNQRFLMKRALDFQPSLLILGTTISDLEDRDVPGPLFTLIADTQPRDPPPWLARAARFSRAAERLARWREQRRVHAAVRRYYAFIFRDDYSGWGKFQRAVRAFRDACRERQIQFVVLIIPPMFDVHVPPGGLEPYSRMLRQFLNAEQIPGLDLLPLLEAYAPARLELVPDVDAHFNELGHRIVAENLFAYLVLNGLVPAAYTPEHMSHASLSRIWGAHQPRIPPSEPP